MPRVVASHLLLLLFGLGMGYAAAPPLMGVAGSLLDPVGSPSPDGSAAAAADDTPEACQPWIAENHALVARLAVLEAAPQDLPRRGSPVAEALGEEAGAPPLPPGAPDEPVAVAAVEALPERFLQRSLVEHFRAAASASGGEVELASVDCTERPCIVYGHAPVAGVAVETLLRSAAFAAYADDRLEILEGPAVPRHGDESSEGARRYFGVVFLPGDALGVDVTELRRRLPLRAQQMWEAVRAEGR